MCTLSWLPHPGGYTFWHGRDERTTRRPADPPRIVHRGALAAVAPRDGEAGGTWVGVNERGLGLGLANLYPPEGIAGGTLPPAGAVTRGRIIDELLGAVSESEAAAQLAAMDLAQFAPFTLAVVQPDAPPRLHRWDGERLASRSVGRPGLLLTSSGAGAALEELRRAEYDRMAPGSPPAADAIDALHRSHLAVLGADSFCMHREVAETASLTWVEVMAGAVRMVYTPGAPCRTHPLGAIELPRGG